MKRHKSILLVEDDKDDQFFFIRALGGIENATLFAVANNGKEALSKLENAARLPDLIFTDINMPVMNGIECLTAIIKNPKICNIPVVILTSAVEQMERAQQLGAKAFIKKPSDPLSLRTELARMINMDFVVVSNNTDQIFKPGYSST